MAAILTTDDARDLRAAAPRRLRVKALRWAVFAFGAIASTVVLSAASGPDCTAAHPCPSEPPNALSVSLFFASWLVLGWWAPRSAAVVAVYSALGGLIWDQTHPADTSLTAELALVVYAALVVAVARLRRDRLPAVSYLGRDRVPVRIPPTTSEIVRLAAGWFLFLVGATVSIATWHATDAWQLLAVLIAAPGLALAETGHHRLQLRHRLMRPNPVAQAELIGGNLFAGDARPGDPPFARLTGSLDGLPRTVLIYGVPVVGQTVAVRSDDQVRLARVRPLKGPIPVSDLRPADLAILPGDEVTASVETVHLQRKPATYGYVLSMAAPLALVEMVRRMPTTAAWTVSVLSTAISFAVGYAIWLRPAVAWSGGGVSARGILTQLSRPWPQIEGSRSRAIWSTSPRRR
jgi:hypothetical protein